MFLGASSSARKNASQFVDLNLVPREYRATGFPFLTAGLALLVVGGLILGYALFYARAYGNLEVAALSKRVTQAQNVVQTATGNPAALAEAQKQRGMQADYQVLKQRQINWSDVLQVIGAAPSGVTIRQVSQAGFGVTVTGSASDQAAVARYVDQLKNSGLFVNAALQTRPGSAAPRAATFSPTVIPTVPRTQPPPTPVSIAPVIVPTPLPSEPLPAYRPPTATPVRVKVATPTITRTSTKTSTPSPSPTPTSAYSYALLSSQQLPLAKPYAGTSDIRGKVIDLKNNPVSGVTVEIDSEASSPWSAQATTGADGTFDFSVTHGKFAVFVTGGGSQTAQDLYTGSDGVAQVFDYQLVFQKTFSGSTSPYAGTPTVTATPTATITPSPSPVSFGANVANLGCASASDNNGSANLATDNNLGTEWNSSRAPSPGQPVWWKWVLPHPHSGSQTPEAGCNAAGLSDTQLQIEAFQLIPDQNPAGNTVHELWLYSDPYCSQNLQSGGGPYYTWQQSTSAGEILPLKLSNPIGVRCVIIDSLADPSFVAWQEIQIYQTPQPPTGFPTFTPTITNTATPVTPGPTAEPTASATAPPTATPTPTSTGTSTPLPTEMPPPGGGSNVASQWPIKVTDASGVLPASTPIVCSPPSGNPTPTPVPNVPCNAIDGNRFTSYAPGSGSKDPQVIVLGSAQMPGNSSLTNVRLELFVNGAPDGGESYQVQVNGTPITACATPTGATTLTDYEQIDCPIPSPTTTPVPGGLGPKVAVILSHTGGTETGNYGVREIEVYQWVAYSAQRKLTPTTKGAGRGPGDDLIPMPTSELTPIRRVGPPTPGSPANQPIPVSTVATGPPVDFTIVLELASGQGYGQ